MTGFLWRIYFSVASHCSIDASCWSIIAAELHDRHVWTSPLAQHSAQIRVTPNVVACWLALLLHIWEVPDLKSQMKHRLFWEIFCDSLYSSTEWASYYLAIWFGWYCFVTLNDCVADDLESIWKEVAVACLSYYLRISLKEWGKQQEILVRIARLWTQI